MKKKIGNTISIIAVLAILSMCFLSVYLLSVANKSFIITSGVTKTSYYSENLTFFASEESTKEVESKSLQNVQSLIGIKNDDKVSLSFESNPIKLTYKNMFSDDEPVEVKVNMVTGTYEFCPIYDDDMNEECWTTVVADYGIQKRIICFGFFNSSFDYNESIKDYQQAKESESSLSHSVSLEPFSINYPIKSSQYTFTLKNYEGRDITTDGFIIEKNVNGAWCVVCEKMNSAAAQKLPDQMKLKNVTIKSGQSRGVKFNVPLYQLFDITDKPHAISGDYRIILSYTVDGEKKLAASKKFSVGFDPQISAVE